MHGIRGATAAGLLLTLAACGGDSTGPRGIDANAALQSLTLGLGTLADPSSPTSTLTNGSLSKLAPLLDQIDVTIGGTSRSMFALGLLETFPPGTCQENIFPDPLFPPDPGVCTPPSLGLVFILWQSHAGNAPPDRLMLLVADRGATDFDFLSSLSPGIALYMEGPDKVWISSSGSLTSAVAATGQTCSLALAPYAKTGTCRVATFDEQGAVAFESLNATSATPALLNVSIPRSTVHGFWADITEIQPLALTAR